MKTQSRAKRAKRVRAKIFGVSGKPRLSVFRSSKYIYAQLIDDSKGITLVSFSDKSIEDKKMKKMERAEKVGQELARLAQDKKINKVSFDRNGYLYHGRVKALAEGARKGGLNF